MKKELRKEIEKELKQKLEPIIQKIIQTEKEARRERLLRLKAMARKKRGRPKNPIPPPDILTEKEREALRSTDVYHLKEKREAYRKLYEKCNFNYSTMKEWLDQNEPVASYDRKILREYVKIGELIDHAVDEVLKKYENVGLDQADLAREINEVAHKYMRKRLHYAFRGESPATRDFSREEEEEQ